ncbi:hypothetical protein Ae406Ps2_6285 [Pseudonocardia sp. Ae406_Ps2]|uniref:hypothetical protein n=1 Tax=unclassified Pseudonocardia TaxID=2619320 RepID=UPI00094B0A7A|nr:MULTISPECIES: hypothetical protein [unclassified Pseudonocardia]OLL89532.1 hypothetical protein Ae331Ps2_6206 [Pseudonocardia sp. Ae331_Ps2]OLL89983.1 hypothetical protein Ae406Ps2_6285 [Pseudonocardia sp. Ae406_Ps2]OLM08723.1 hypothetical protein Ae706Ps2_6675 [Pseudonocardia sp. Ae706_Ps2]
MSFFLLTLCAVAVLWQVSGLARSGVTRDSLSAVAFSAGVGAMVLLYREDVGVLLDSLLGANVTAVVRNLVLVAAFAAMQFFYIRNIATFRPTARHYVERGAFTVACALLITSPFFVGSTAALKASPENLHDPAVLLFFLSGSCYLLYACVTQVAWSLRDAGRFMRHRFYSFFAATAALALGCSLYFVLVARRVFHYYVSLTSGPEHITMWPPPIGTILICLSVSFMALGVTLPLAAADIHRWIRRAATTRANRQLRELDSVVCALFPRLLIPEVPEYEDGCPAAPGSASGMRSAHELRENRCSDGYGRLHDIITGGSDTGRADIAAAIDILTAIPGGLPVACESGDTRHLIRISRWLKKNRAAAALDTMTAAPSTVPVVSTEKGET